MACACTSPPVWLGTTELTNLQVNLTPGPGRRLLWAEGCFGKACFATDLGFKEIHVDARAGYVMAARGAGGAAGPAPRHQPSESGKAIYIYCGYSITCKHAGSLMVKAAGYYAHDCGFVPSSLQFFFVFLVHGKVKLYLPCMYMVYTWSKPVSTQTYIQIPVYSCVYTVWTFYEWNTCIHYCIYVFVHDTYMA